VVKKTFPLAASVRHLTQPFPCLVIQDSAERVLGYDVFSDSAGVTAKGYAGMVPVQVFLDSQAKPLRIYVLDNSETPAYLDLVLGAGLPDRLLAFDPAEPDSVDAVTLATSSSRAIITGVTRLAARVWAELVKKSSAGPR
jgi:Na+-translocating ferredoxin:NAD+ oxidoreductase RnfG subunit